jgi:glycosyltransferase involved in cell wall biosynthesis
MRVAVVTPYYKESDDVLAQCHGSVLDQQAPCDHFLVADGFPNPLVAGWRAEHFVMPRAHADNGNTPRVAGAISAFNLGYEAVAFLDADNWFRPDHVARMMALHRQTGAAACTSNRTMQHPDGSYMFDDDKNDGRTHVDTSCLFMTRAVLPVLVRWAMMPRQLGPICDTVYWSTICQAGLSHAHDPATTVAFRTTYEADFRRAGLPMPENVKTLHMNMEPIRWLKSLPAAERQSLRSELGWDADLLGRITRRVSRAMTRKATALNLVPAR